MFAVTVDSEAREEVNATMEAMAVGTRVREAGARVEVSSGEVRVAAWSMMAATVDSEAREAVNGETMEAMAVR